ncbi:MAG TPA: adenylate/guanylate cyclase domain-containing protein [Gaiellaceae bacterium]
MERELPAGTVTFLFTDVEGSTNLLNELGAERYAETLADHRRVLRETFERHGGAEVDTQGDAFFVAFATAPAAVAAVREAQEALEIPVRMGLHTGTPLVTAEGYVGTDVHRAARIAAAGSGGQVLVSSATAALTGRGGLRDLGEHRLKDLSAPERIYQLGKEEFPPLKTLYRTNLPVPATPFLGRERELAQVVELLADTRLLTLTGPGGTGKTRLALQAAAETSDRYPDGVFWVSLSPVRDARLVFEQAAQAVGARSGLVEYVADKRLLLLLDNLEHLIDAADELAGLTASCPNLQLLVTSRELLRLPGEQAYRVPPLEAHDGTRFFLARARAVDPDFEPDDAVPQLCARLEQLPLALELAAARIRLLSPAQLLERLSGRLDLLRAGRGVDPRQETLRATIEWSHELLDGDEKRLFARLGVFVGGCTLEAAQEICEADIDTLQSLVDKSLVPVREGNRFWMLETIREYALERLGASGEADEQHRRHADYYLAFAERAEVHLFDYSPEWLDRVEQEMPNLRAALDQLEATARHEELLRLAAAISRLWGTRGSMHEGRRRLEAALAADGRPTAARAKALTAAADLALGQGDDERVEELAREALPLHRANGNDWAAVESLLLLAHAAADRRDFGRARDLAEEAAHAAKPESLHASQALWQLGWAEAGLGERDRARGLYEEALQLARATGSVNTQSLALSGLSRLAINDGRPAEALPLVQESFRLDWESRDHWRLAIDATRLARTLAALGKARPAARLLAGGKALFEEIGAAPSWRAGEDDETLALLREQLSEAELAQQLERGAKLHPEELVDLALQPVELG